MNYPYFGSTHCIFIQAYTTEQSSEQFTARTTGVPKAGMNPLRLSSELIQCLGAI